MIPLILSQLVADADLRAKYSDEHYEEEVEELFRQKFSHNLQVSWPTGKQPDRYEFGAAQGTHGRRGGRQAGRRQAAGRQAGWMDGWLAGFGRKNEMHFGRGEDFAAAAANARACRKPARTGRPAGRPSECNSVS